jgi:hypothetical protein
MNAKLAVFLLACTVSLHGQKTVTHPPIQQSSPARYQLTSLEIDDGEGKATVVFLLDSKTGRVWRYQHPSVGKTKDNTPISFPEAFISIEVWQPREGVKVYPSDDN